MDKAGSTIRPKYYVLEKNSAISDSDLESSRGTDQFALGARIEKIKINGKEKHVAVLYLSDKTKMLPESLLEMQKHREMAAECVSELLDKFLSQKGQPREVRQDNVKKLMDASAISIEYEFEKNVVKNGRETKIRAKAWESSNLVDAKSFLPLAAAMRLPVRDEIGSELSLKPIKSIIKGSTEKNFHKKQMQKKLSKIATENSTKNMRGDEKTREEEFFKKKTNFSTKKVENPVVLASGVAPLDESQTASREAIENPLPTASVLQPEDLPMTTSTFVPRSARDIAKPLLSPETIIRKKNSS